MNFHHIPRILFVSIFVTFSLFGAERTKNIEAQQALSSRLFDFAKTGEWDAIRNELADKPLPTDTYAIGCIKDHVDENGDTLLNLAVKSNDKTAVEFLLTKDAQVQFNPLFKGKEEWSVSCNQTSLHWAVQLGRDEIIEMLIKADPKSVCSYGAEFADSPLTLAISFDQYSAASILLKNGAQIEHSNNSYRNTAFHIAVLRKNAESLKILLAHASPETLEAAQAKNVNGHSPLMLSCHPTTASPEIQTMLLTYFSQKLSFSAYQACEIAHNEYVSRMQKIES